MAKDKPLTELEVGSIVSSEIKASLGYIGSDITEQRQKSLEYYFGEPFGNEQEGRSQVVSTDVSDVIDADAYDAAAPTDAVPDTLVVGGW